MLSRLLSWFQKAIPVEPPLTDDTGVCSEEWLQWYMRRFKVTRNLAVLANEVLVTPPSEPYAMEDNSGWIQWARRHLEGLTSDHLILMMDNFRKEERLYRDIVEPALLLDSKEINPTWVTWFAAVKGCTRKRATIEAITRAIRIGVFPARMKAVRISHG